MDTIELLKPVLTDGIRNINFFNGRLLTARDLSQEQSVNREALRRLGRAVGSGVAEGFEVFISPSAKPNAPIVTIKPGLAVNSLGQMLSLSNQVELTLVRPTSARTNLFVTCQPPQSGTFVGVAGVYLLTVAPAEAPEGRAQASGLGGSAACGADIVIEGVQFRLLQLNITPAELNDAARLRNRVAYKCFGADDQRTIDFLRNPFDQSLSEYGLIDDLRSSCLHDNEVPLVVIHWTASNGIRFVDRWSARRRLIDPESAAQWKVLAGDRRLAEAEAGFLQFQDQLESLRQLGVEQDIPADANFLYLPPAGLLSIGQGGFDWHKFLGPLAPVAPKQLDKGLVRSVIVRSFLEDPIRIGSFADSAIADKNPPTPLDVFQVPGERGFVIFARSRLGRIRVFLSPPNITIQPGAIYAQGNLATTRHNAPSGSNGPFIIEDVPPAEYQVFATVKNYQDPSPQPVTVIGGYTIDVSFTLTPLANGRLTITVQDSSGARLVNVRVTLSGQDSSRRLAVTNQAGACTFANLPAGIYSAGLASFGVTLSGIVIDLGDDLSRVMTVGLKGTTSEPKRVFEFSGIKKPALGNGQFTMMYALRKTKGALFLETEPILAALTAGVSRAPIVVSNTNAYILPIFEERHAYQKYYGKNQGAIKITDRPWLEMIQIEPVSDKLAAWLAAWQNFLAEAKDHPEIAKAIPVIYADRQYEPPKNMRTIPKQWQAYAVFGSFGVPLLVTPAYKRTRYPVDLSKTVIPGLRNDLLDRFRDLDIRYLDQFAVMPEDIVVDLTGDPPEFIRLQIGRALEFVDDINEKRSYYDRLDEPANKALITLGLTTDVTLANANPAKLASEIKKELGNTPEVELISQLQAESLISQARVIVPTDAWSLEPLGLTRGQISNLAETGIMSQMDFIDRAERDANRLAGLLGISLQAVADLQQTAITNLTSSSIRHNAVTNLHAVVGVNAQIAEKLTASNLDSVRKLANASEAEIVNATGLSGPSASQLKVEAGKLVGETLGAGILGSISVAEKTALEADGIMSVGDMLKADPAIITGILGNDQSRANAIINGLRIGFGRP